MSSGIENLKKIQTTEEARERGSKGGIASGESRRRKKLLKDCLNLLLEEEKEVKDRNGNAVKDENGNPVLKSGAEMLAIKAFQEALKGNPKWWELVRDTAGQKPVEVIKYAEVDEKLIEEIEKTVLEE